jgi:toxin YxiD
MNSNLTLPLKDSRKTLETSHTLKFDTTFMIYLKDIERATNRIIPNKQIEILKYKIEHNDYQRLNTKQSHAHRSKFNSRKADIIADWERENHEKWPTYKEPVYSRKGKVIRLTGARYDAHHIIENSWGGDNEWYNMIPARHPDEHQKDIHRNGGPADRIYNEHNKKRRSNYSIRDVIRTQRNRRRVVNN